MAENNTEVFYEENHWYSSARFALYSYEIEKIRLIITSLAADHEKNLESFLLRRLKKGAIYVGSGNFSVMEFSLDLITKSPATCFYISLPCWNSIQMISCLIAPPEAHLELFRNELQNFCISQINKLKEIQPDLMKLETTSVEIEFKNWPHYSIDFLSRTVKTLKTDIAFVLQAALLQQNVIITEKLSAPEWKDLRTFVMTARITDSQFDNLEDESLIALDDAVAVAKNTPCSPCCIEWAKLLTKESQSVANIKKILEAIKLKMIRDLNLLRRLLMQAECDLYALYRSCAFLRQTNTATLVLNHCLDDADSPKEVISLLKQYLIDTDTY